MSNCVHRHVSDVGQFTLQQRHGEFVERARRSAAARRLAIAALAAKAVRRGARTHGKTRQFVAVTRPSAQCVYTACGVEHAHDLM